MKQELHETGGSIYLKSGKKVIVNNAIQKRKIIRGLKQVDQCNKGVSARLPATAKYQQLCTNCNRLIKITHLIYKYQYTLHCTSTLCTVPVQSSQYQYTLQYIAYCRPKAGKIFCASSDWLNSRHSTNLKGDKSTSTMVQKIYNSTSF